MGAYVADRLDRTGIVAANLRTKKEVATNWRQNKMVIRHDAKIYRIARAQLLPCGDFVRSVCDR